MSATTNITILLRAVDNASNTIKKVGDSTEGLLGKIKGALGKLGGVASMAAGVFTGMIGAQALDAVQDFVGGSVESFSNFEQKLKNIQVFAGLTEKQAEQLGKTLLDMSSRSVFSVGELQDAMVDLARAGIVGEDAIRLLQSGMTGAMAAGEDLNSTVNVALQAIRAFGLSVEDSNRVMDILINAANVSQASVADLGTALGYVGPVAASAGMNLEDMSAAIAYLTNVGFDASMAGTYLRGVIGNLLNPTKNAKEAMEEFGVQIYDAEGKLKPFPQIIAEFRERLKGLGDAEVTQALMRVFDTRAATAMAALINANQEGWEELRGAIEETGVAERQASEMMDTHQGAMKRLQAAMEAARVELGEALAPLIEKATDLFVKMLPYISKAVKFFAELGSKALDVAGPALLRFVEILDSLFANIDKVLGPLKKLYDFFTGLSNIKLPTFNLPSFNLPGFSIPKTTAGSVQINIDMHDNDIASEVDREELLYEMGQSTVDQLRMHGVIP